MRKIKRFLSALLCGAILITGTLAGVSVRTDAAASSYAVQLRAAGFPDSYIRALSALHTAYPQWQFQAVKTGLDWNTVVSKESVNGVNLVPKTGNDATKSTADGAYDWTTNVWTVYDGSSWVGANSKYIAYYLDPRNFLNETDIFQFESLSFSKVQTKQGVSSILKGTFMENTVEDSDGSALDYAQAFMDIGEETGVSPYHLASRVRQEQRALPPHWSSKTDWHMQKKRDGIPVMQRSKEAQKFWRKTTLAWVRIRCISRSLM